MLNLTTLASAVPEILVTTKI